MCSGAGVTAGKPSNRDARLSLVAGAVTRHSYLHPLCSVTHTWNSNHLYSARSPLELSLKAKNSHDSFSMVTEMPVFFVELSIMTKKHKKINQSEIFMENIICFFMLFRSSYSFRY